MGHREADVANIDMIGRMITAAGRRVGGYDPDQLARLAELHKVLDAAMVEAVDGQRSAGVTWSSIGEALGVTKEAVVMRYRPQLVARREAEARRWADLEALDAGESVPGGPGACADCGHGKVWHHRGGRWHRCERCACEGWTETPTACAVV